MWIVYGMVSVSPKASPAPDEVPVGSAVVSNTPTARTVTISVDTDTFPEGVYLAIARTEDAHGNAAKNAIPIVIDRGGCASAADCGCDAACVDGMCR